MSAAVAVIVQIHVPSAEVHTKMDKLPQWKDSTNMYCSRVNTMKKVANSYFLEVDVLNMRRAVCLLCPTINYCFCTWIGLEKDAIEHCKETHPDVQIFEGPTLFCKLTYEAPSGKRNAVDFLIYSFGRILHCKIIPNFDAISNATVSLENSTEIERLEHVFDVKTFDIRTQSLCYPITNVFVSTLKTVAKDQYGAIKKNCCDF